MTDRYAPRASARAQRTLRVLLSSQAALEVIQFAFGALAVNPRSAGSALGGADDGRWRAKVGGVTILYEIDDQAREVRIVAVLPYDGAGA